MRADSNGRSTPGRFPPRGCRRPWASQCGATCASGLLGSLGGRAPGHAAAPSGCCAPLRLRAHSWRCVSCALPAGSSAEERVTCCSPRDGLSARSGIPYWHGSVEELAPAASLESLEALQQGGAASRTRLARSCQQEAWHEQEQLPCPLCNDARRWVRRFGECNPLSACTNARRTPAARKRGTSRIAPPRAVAAARVSSRAAESLVASGGAAAAVGLRRPRRPLPLRARRPAPSAAGAVGEPVGHEHSGVCLCAIAVTCRSCGRCCSATAAASTRST